MKVVKRAEAKCEKMPCLTHLQEYGIQRVSAPSQKAPHYIGLSRDFITLLHIVTLRLTAELTAKRVFRWLNRGG
jgi:hypothetical protein